MRFLSHIDWRCRVSSYCCHRQEPAFLLVGGGDVTAFSPFWLCRAVRSWNSGKSRHVKRGPTDTWDTVVFLLSVKFQGETTNIKGRCHPSVLSFAWTWIWIYKRLRKRSFVQVTVIPEKLWAAYKPSRFSIMDITPSDYLWLRILGPLALLSTDVWASTHSYAYGSTFKWANSWSICMQ